MAVKAGLNQDPAFILPGAIAALQRNPGYRDVFPIGASLLDWVVAGV